MIKFFRKIRQRLLSENKFSKYLLYAFGEIVLVVIGILIALQINNWNQEKENNKLKVFYMKSLMNDLNIDTLDINRITQIQVSDNHKTNDFLNRIYSQSATIDTIVKIAKKEFEYAFQVKRDYSNNTFNTIISSGNIELLDRELIEKLMELNSLQTDQLKRFQSNLDSYLDVVSNYSKSFSVVNSNAPENNIIDSILWNNINEKEFVGNFTTVLKLREFTFDNTIKGHLKVKEKTIETLNLIERLLGE
ncbi:DUF6090 family protein [Xanthomarina sp. GH4-25]|uniref:DUF6090 family protein n=1 Tax=Xanthomarina sp. GH4-25 TaxID=3349335 RepID=UPI003877AED3